MEGDGSNGDGEGASSLDHALLESLFYNEMLLMDESSPLSPPDLSLLSSPAPPNTQNATLAPEPLVMPESAVQNNLPDAAQAPPMNGSLAHNAMPPAPMASDSWTDSTSRVPAAAPQAAEEVSQMSQERAQHLVSQFATLASRLGISLPPSVLSSLTASAAANEAHNVAPAVQPIQPAPAVTLPGPESSASAVWPPTTASTVTNKVQQLESTAQAAIAAVTETRKRKDEEPATGNRPLYSKRRKKARLSDCEAKLAQLRQENDMLKRHLATVTNKAQIFDQGRKVAQQEMKRAMQQGASPEKINPLLSKFSEMYSDYGRHRHQELTFHLGQLEKLAAPTTFTKMGLWTLGQNEAFYTNPKRNPIAGILRKELGITPVQGRKILEQRQKIRDVCDNLRQCLVLIGKLKGICEHKQKIFHDRMTKVQTILTPLQVVKLLLWVDEHSHLLESVCPGWGSEQIRSTETKPKAT